MIKINNKNKQNKRRQLCRDKLLFKIKAEHKKLKFLSARIGLAWRGLGGFFRGIEERIEGNKLTFVKRGRSTLDSYGV